MRTTTTDKYYEALKDLEFQIKMRGRVNSQKLAVEHGVTRGFVSYAQRISIVKKTSEGYEWKAGRPSKIMAERLHTYINSEIRQQANQHKAPATKVRQKRKAKTTETISILWGLYKKTVTK